MAIPTGDYGEQHRINTGRDTSASLAAATAGPVTLMTSRGANYIIFVQRIKVSVTTYSAKTMAFADSAGSPVPIAFFSVPAAAPTNAGAQQYEVDFGPHGFPLTAGANLVLTLSGAGIAAAITIDAYDKLITTGVVQGTAN